MFGLEKNWREDEDRARIAEERLAEEKTLNDNLDVKRRRSGSWEEVVPLPPPPALLLVIFNNPAAYTRSPRSTYGH